MILLFILVSVILSVIAVYSIAYLLMKNIRLYVYRRDDTLNILKKSYSRDAGVDLYAPQSLVIPAHSSAFINVMTSLYIHNPLDFLLDTYIQVKGRSGLSAKFNIEMSSAGVIDKEYIGDIKVQLYNFSDTDYEINKNDKIVQVIPIFIPRFLNIIDVDYDTLQKVSRKSRRKDKGFGSTGK